jgi:hypothetical protein
MRVICAWCEKFIKEKEPINNRTISHGICDKCAWKLKGATIKWIRQKDNDKNTGEYHNQSFAKPFR